MKSDLQTLVITTTGLLWHINRVYPIGAKGDELLDCYEANIMSVCFVLAVLLLLSMRELWPSVLRRPSRPVHFLYLALLSAFTVSVSLRLVWLPLTMSLTKSNLWLASKIKRTKFLHQSLLAKTVNMLESRLFHKAEMAILAFSFLGYALKACGVHEEFVKETDTTLNNLYLARRYIGRSRVSFAPRNSEYSIPYILKNKLEPGPKLKLNRR